MRTHGFGDQPQSANQQDQHNQGIEKRLRPEIDVHVGDHAGQDEQRPGGGEQPSDGLRPLKNRMPTPNNNGMSVTPKLLVPQKLQ